MKEWLIQRLVFSLPQVTTDNYFNREVVILLFLVLTIIIGSAMCFYGYKSFMLISFLLYGCAAGFISINILDRLITNPMELMYLFLICVTLLVLLFYELYNRYVMAVRAYRIGKGGKLTKAIGRLDLFMTSRYDTETPIRDFLEFISPAIGAIAVSTTVYFLVIRCIPVCITLALLLGTAGFFYQKKNRKDKRKFYTYNDIYYGR